MEKQLVLLAPVVGDLTRKAEQSAVVATSIDEGLCIVGVDATAAAAAVAYCIDGRAGGRVADGKPALRMLAMGCCAKFGFGGGFTVKDM